MDISTVCRKVAAEGAVLLKNEKKVLPLKKGTKVALFGRMQTTYYKSGTGSGGLVHLVKEPCILEALKSDEDIFLDEELVSIYENWVKDHPFNDGGGVWAGEPWFQEEMPVDYALAKTVSERNEVAVVIIGRTAGEDHDNANESGSYSLTNVEEDLLKNVTSNFEKVVVALNVGNIIDLSFLDRYNVSSLLYIWQGGMEGDKAFADILTGKTAPSGKLTDTQAINISDYPSDKNFGAENKNIYEEDIYVGYRYFETFAKDKVRFPFGFGLTYTTFDVKAEAQEKDGLIIVHATVKNTGESTGREVVQVYYNAPTGKLGTPARQLVAFAKTKDIPAGETENVVLSFSVDEMSSYDDSGVTGNKSCYVLEKGDYEIFVGTCVRCAKPVFTYMVKEDTVTAKLEEVMAPVENFKRLVAREKDGKIIESYEAVPTATIDLLSRINERRPEDIAYSGNQGIKLKDVKEGKNTIEEFVSQLTDTQLAALVCGEGMGSPKATPGTVGAVGGQCEDLQDYGIPVCCVTDGPSGIRLDTGKKASLIPNGTLLASTWDIDVVQDIYSCIGKELKDNCVDSLLGPGINIHRHPLCGRNFEYFSEDPFLAGKIAAASTRGIGKFGAYATIKHFVCNNQEKNRHSCESVVSERALREIYLKPFEIAVKEGKNVLIMTSYNPVNGYWSASNYDLNTTVLRKEWKFDNFVMTDWWAKCNLEAHGIADVHKTQAMVRAWNDVYMVCENANSKADTVLKGLKSGYISRGDIQKCVITILNWIIRTNTFEEYVSNGCKAKYPVSIDESKFKYISSLEGIDADTVYGLKGENRKKGLFTFTISSDADVLSQNIITVKVDWEVVTISIPGTKGEKIEVKRFIWVGDGEEGNHKFSVSHSDLIKIHNVDLKQ